MSAVWKVFAIVLVLTAVADCSLLEIIYVVDGSGSIGLENFSLVKEWLVNQIRKIHDIFGRNARTEVLQFSSKDASWKNVPVEKSTKFVIPYTLEDTLTSDEIQQRIINMTYLNEATYTYYALRRVMEIEFHRSPHYKTSTKIVVVVTDGEAHDGAYLGRWYDKYKNNITSFAVGIGHYEAFRKQLQSIANGGNSNERVFTVNDFVGLENVTQALVSKISDIAPNLTTVSTTTETTTEMETTERIKTNTTKGKTSHSIKESTKPSRGGCANWTCETWIFVTLYILQSCFVKILT